MQSELPYEERGGGDPVMLVPGTGERRGFGSAAPQEAKDMRVHADDADSILRRTGGLPADVVGWSGGGLVALALAVEHPDACRSLLLIEPSLHGLRAITASAVLMTLRAQIARLRGGQRAATDLAYRWTFTYRGLGRNAWDQMPARWRGGVLDHAHAVAAEQSHELSTGYPSVDQLRGLDLPVKIVIGERSQPYFHRIARRLQRLLPRAELRSVSDASHAVHLDSPGELAALVG